MHWNMNVQTLDIAPPLPVSVTVPLGGLGGALSTQSPQVTELWFIVQASVALDGNVQVLHGAGVGVGVGVPQQHCGQNRKPPPDDVRSEPLVAIAGRGSTHGHGNGGSGGVMIARARGHARFADFAFVPTRPAVGLARRRT